MVITGRTHSRFKPNEGREKKDRNQTRVLNMTINENNIIVNPSQFKIQSMKEMNFDHR